MCFRKKLVNFIGFFNHGKPCAHCISFLPCYPIKHGNFHLTLFLLVHGKIKRISFFPQNMEFFLKVIWQILARLHGKFFRIFFTKNNIKMAIIFCSTPTNSFLLRTFYDGKFICYTMAIFFLCHGKLFFSDHVNSFFK